MGRIFLDILAPVFLLVAVGWVAGRRLDLSPGTLSRLSYWILGPAFMFDVFASAELEADLVVRMVLSALGGIAAAGAVGWFASRAAQRPSPVRGATVMTSIHGNVGNFGLAIVAFTYGDDALPLAGLAFLVINTSGLLVGISAATAQRSSSLTAIRVALLAPMVLAVFPAIAVNTADAEVPLWLDRPVALLAGALIPVMLVTLGLQLAGMTRFRVSGDQVIPIGAKLVVAPLAAAGATAVLGLGGVPQGVVVLQSAMPAAVFTSLVALEHDLEPDLVTTVVLGGTLVSLATLPVVISLVG